MTLRITITIEGAAHRAIAASLPERLEHLGWRFARAESRPGGRRTELVFFAEESPE